VTIEKDLNEYLTENNQKIKNESEIKENIHQDEEEVIQKTEEVKSVKEKIENIKEANKGGTKEKPDTKNNESFSNKSPRIDIILKNRNEIEKEDIKLERFLKSTSGLSIFYIILEKEMNSQILKSYIDSKNLLFELEVEKKNEDEFIEEEIEAFFVKVVKYLEKYYDGFNFGSEIQNKIDKYISFKNKNEKNQVKFNGMFKI
jgi:hypothetical protein